MDTRKKLFEVRGLTTRFHTEAGVATAIDRVDFDIYAGEVLGVVGESGSGKSVTALSLVRLIPTPPGEISAGSVLFGGRDLLQLSYAELHRVRGKDVAMIFQEPMIEPEPGVHGRLPDRGDPRRAREAGQGRAPAARRWSCSSWWAFRTPGSA